MVELHQISINEWIDRLLARGVYGFATAALRHSLPDYSEIAVKRALSRLSTKGKIVSLYKGYYLILPPQYVAKGILPPTMYLDAFMKHLQRPYYVALLNAAAFHGASHQQPQEFFVMTVFPVLRPTIKKGTKANYISIRTIPESLIEKRKTAAGYLNISKAVLTACDLVQFEKRIGGINRVATVLHELAEVMQPTDFTSEIVRYAPVTTLQRLGYLLENVCFHPTLADALFVALKKEVLNLFRIPLKASRNAKGYSSDNRWKVIVNTDITIDL